jgi:predicted transcriptional regulator
MTLQIELTPEIEAKLRKQAAEAGKDVASVAREAIEESISLREDGGETAPRMSRERRVAEFWLGPRVIGR